MGICGNEIVDIEAKIASLGEERVELPRHRNDIKKQMERYITRQMDKQWNEATKSETVTVKSFFHKKKDCKILADRKEVPWEINQIATGHCNLNSYLARIGKKDNALWSCCLEEENVHHYVFTCNKYENFRKGLGKDKTDSIWNQRDLHVMIATEENFTNFLQFIKQTGRLDFHK